MVAQRLGKMARRFRTRQSGPKRKISWIGGVNVIPTNEANLAGQTAVLHSSLDTRLAANSKAVGFTIVRTLGTFGVTVQASSTRTNVIGAFGICIVNGEAFDAGVASLPTPWTESPDNRWYVHQYFNFTSIPGTGNVSNVGSAVGEQIMIDSKGMRKLNEGDVFCLMVENASLDSMAFYFNVRTAVKLS